MSNEMKFVLLICVVIAVVYFMNKRSKSSRTKMQMMQQPKLRDTEMKVMKVMKGMMRDRNEDMGGGSGGDSSVYDDVEGFSETNDESSNESSESSELSKYSSRSKFDSKNKSKVNHKKVNYSEGVRGGGDFSSYFDDNNEVVRNGQMGNNEFVGNDETNGKYAAYEGGKTGQKMSDAVMFNAETWLPKEKRDDWFDIVEEPISVKNRHLINVARPIGVNTVGNSLRNASYDLRGTIPNPKFNVGPWNNSTIEPDYNNKGFC